MNTKPFRTLAEEMKKLRDITGSLATPILVAYEEYKVIQQVFQRVKQATTTFHVRTLIFM